MSNPYRNLEAFEREVRRRSMIEAAILKRYHQRGGDALDERIAILNTVNKGSRICRQADLDRLEKDANAMREKGERPIFSVSETRLYITKSEQLEKRRAEELAMARSQIMAVLERVQPPTEDSLKVVLDLELNTVSDETRKAMKAAQEDMRKDLELDEHRLKPIHLLLSQVPNLEHRAAMMECLRTGDETRFSELFLLQSDEWRRKWDELTLKVNRMHS
jgi:hypothetical protein